MIFMVFKKCQPILTFIAALFLALLFGHYRQTLSQAESVHFSLNFPAKTVKEAGGLGPRGHEGIVFVNLTRVGIFKRLIQPDVVNISSHWIKNVSKRPIRIKIRLVNCDFPVYVSTPEKSWNDSAKTFERKINPGEMISMDWNIVLPSEVLQKRVILNSAVEVIDAEAGQQISYLPIKIINTEDKKITDKVDCCAR